MTSRQTVTLFPRSIYGKSAMLERQRARLAGEMNAPIRRRKKKIERTGELGV